MDKLEEIRQKELEVQKKQLFAQRVTAAASVASAVAAHKQAAATKEIQQQMAADAERNKLHQMLMAVQQKQMADDQRLTNFRTTVLATLPLLKDAEEKKQYLTEQLLPKLKDEIDVPKISPIAVISLAADRWSNDGTLKKILENEEGQDLETFLSTGKDLLERTGKWMEECSVREKQVSEFREAEAKLGRLQKRFGFLDAVKIGLWTLLLMFIFGIISAGLTDNGTSQQELTNSDDFNAALFCGSTAFGALLHFCLKRRKIKKLKAKVKLLTPPDDLQLKKEREEIVKKFKSQDEKWEVFKPRIVNIIMKYNKDFITGDPHSVLLEIITVFLKSRVNELQSFLPPNSRLSESHYAQYFIDEADARNFRDGLTTIENDLKNLLLPFYREQTIALGNAEALMEAEQIRAFASGNTEAAAKTERDGAGIIEAKNKIRPADEKHQSNKTAIQVAEDFKSKIKDKRIFFHPHIPPKMLGKIGATYVSAAYNKNETVICLIDETLIAKDASDGIAITADAIYWHELGQTSQMIPLREIKQIAYEKKIFKRFLKINSHELSTLAEPDNMEQIAAMIIALRDLT